MSISLILDLWKSNLPITSSQKLVLHCLAFFTNDDKDGACYPSYTTIADKCGLTRRGVIKIIEQLCFIGLLTKEKCENNSNRYRITLSASERGSPGVVNTVHQGSEPGSPNLINDLIIDLKENNIKERNEYRKTAKEVIRFLKTKTGRNYQFVDTTLKPIISLLREGITLEQCKQVIVRKHREWAHKPDMEKFLRPSTLFRRSNFYDKYLPELVTDEDKKNIMKGEK